MIAALGQSRVSVHDGDSIQKAIDAATPGDVIEVYSGTYQESLEIKKSLTIRGIDSGSGLPLVESDRSSAISIVADNVTLQGFQARSSSGWSEDAGILVTSDGNLLAGNAANSGGNIGIILTDADDNILRGNSASENRNEGISLRNSSRNLVEDNRLNQNRYGIKLVDSNQNIIRSNTASNNRLEAIFMQNSLANLVRDNFALGNAGGIYLEGSKDNNITANDLIDNEKGIYISNHNASESLSTGKAGVSISYSGMSSSDVRRSGNNTIFLNNLSNGENAYDDGLNSWSLDSLGNNYSDFNDLEEGCSGSKVCSAEYRISGGSSVDRYPLVKVEPPKIPAARASGPQGARISIDRSYYLPGRDILVNFTAPAESQAGAAMMQGNLTLDEQYLGQNNSGMLAFTAPEDEGVYRLRMYDQTGKEITSLSFDVTSPHISTAVDSARTCEKIMVSYSGAPGLDKDWIGMFSSGSSDPVSLQYLKGNPSGNLSFSTQNPGTYHFSMFEAGQSTSISRSGDVTVEAVGGVKLIAEPSKVSPGGTITVTFWGAPSSGTGVIGMYGMTRPDKFHIEKRAVGSRSCGTMTFRAPSTPGQYDFRMFENDVYRPLMVQSNVVTVA